MYKQTTYSTLASTLLCFSAFSLLIKLGSGSIFLPVCGAQAIGHAPNLETFAGLM